MRLKCYAKLNLSLDVTGKLPNGYHTLESVMQTISLHDTLEINPDDSNTITVHCEKVDGENIVEKAAKLFFEETKIQNKGLKIAINKEIPMAAGLGGGSSNAAAVICALDKIYGTNLSEDTLCEMALKIGADVPFFIKGGTAIVKGIGEELSPISNLPDCKILLVKADTKPSTKEMYEKIDNLDKPYHPNTNLVAKGIKNGSLDEAVKEMGNSFETAWDKTSVPKIKSVLKSFNVLYAGLSGSGPTVFGVFPKETDLSECMNALEKFDCFKSIATPTKCGFEIVEE